jgi:hypothetical protein
VGKWDGWGLGKTKGGRREWRMGLA